MKKNIMNWMTIMLMAVLCVGLVSCSKDDDDDSVAIPSGLVGTWYKTSGASKYSMSFSFTSAGTGTGNVSHNNIISKSAFAFKFSYKSNGEVVCEGTRVMSDEDKTETTSANLKFRYSSGKLTFTDAPNTAWVGAVVEKN